MTDKMVMVPVEELQKLEEARVALYEILEKRKTLNSTEFLVSLSPVTSHMWKLSNTRWPEIESAPNVESEPVPDMFWNYHDTEFGFTSPCELAVDYSDAYLEYGESVELKIQTATTLPNRKMKITAPVDDDGETTWEWVDD